MLGWAGLGYAGLDWTGMDQACAGLGYAGWLDWDRIGWAGM